MEVNLLKSQVKSWKLVAMEEIESGGGIFFQRYYQSGIFSFASLENFKTKKKKNFESYPIPL